MGAHNPATNCHVSIPELIQGFHPQSGCHFEKPTVGDEYKKIYWGLNMPFWTPWSSGVAISEKVAQLLGEDGTTNTIQHHLTKSLQDGDLLRHHAEMTPNQKKRHTIMPFQVD